MMLFWTILTVLDSLLLFGTPFIALVGGSEVTAVDCVEVRCCGGILRYHFCFPTVSVQYFKGDANSKIILVSGHGGTLNPGNVSERINGCSPTNVKKECVFNVSESVLQDCGY